MGKLFPNNQVGQVFVATSVTTSGAAPAADGALQVKTGVAGGFKINVQKKGHVTGTNNILAADVYNATYQIAPEENCRIYGVGPFVATTNADDIATLDVEIMGGISGAQDETYYKNVAVKGIYTQVALAQALAQAFSKACSREASKVTVDGTEFFSAFAIGAVTAVASGVATVVVYDLNGNVATTLTISDGTATQLQVGQVALITLPQEYVFGRISDDAIPAINAYGYQTVGNVTEYNYACGDSIRPDGGVGTDVVRDEFEQTLTGALAAPKVNSHKVADMEWFFLGNRGDQYRNMGWPNVVSTEYAVNPENAYGYDIVTLEYGKAGYGTVSGAQRQKQQVYILCERDSSDTAGSLGAVATAVNAALNTYGSVTVAAGKAVAGNY